jgi:hypothetical protein
MRKFYVCGAGVAHSSPQPGGEDPFEAIQLRAAPEISACEASERETPSKDASLISPVHSSMP